MDGGEKYWTKRFKKELVEEDRLKQEVDQAVKKKLAEIEEESEPQSS